MSECCWITLVRYTAVCTPSDHAILNYVTVAVTVMSQKTHLLSQLWQVHHWQQG
jgi:hypothetical protein